MDTFRYDDQYLTCDGIRLADIARETGTPVYIYSAGTIRAAFRELDGAFAGYPHAVHYALKANSTLAVARLIRSLGGGVDANSGGEIEVALAAGFQPSDIVFTGVGKTAAEIQRAIALDVKAINVESAGELDRVDAMARSLGRRARVALRVNPDIDARSHPHISTGRSTDKFGIPLDVAAELGRQAPERAGVRLTGLHVHIGSQVTELDPLVRAARTLVDLARNAADSGVTLEHLDVGGGLGISYDGVQRVPTAAEYASAILPVIRTSGLALLIEPGRRLVGPAGVLVAQVIDIKPGGTRQLVVLDTGMTELLRPALYNAFHRIDAVTVRPGATTCCEVVGPLCESSDVVGRDRQLPALEVGDLLAIRDTGAYGIVMASNYNRRRFPAEVLVEEDGRWHVIRRRQTYEELMAFEE